MLTYACLGAFVAYSQLCGAQIPQFVPDAGRIQELQRAPTPPPVIERPEIRIEPPQAREKIDTPPFFVAGFRITGATVFAEAELLGIVGPVGEPLTLREVEARAERLTKFYNDQGYSVAQALVPAQDVREGVVEIRVLEGRYGRIEIRNATEVSETRIRALLGNAAEDELVHMPTLERGVLLVSDLAGVLPKATLEPGESTGLTDLILEIGAGKQAEYDLSFDNAGSLYTGRNRISAGVTVNSPADIGDRILARVTTSGKDLLAYRLAYELPLGIPGLRGGPYASRTTYLLGNTFAPLDASGTADAVGASVTYPVIRSSAVNLRATVTAERRKLEDRVNVTSTVNDKNAKALQLGLGGDFRDEVLAGGVTSFQGLLTNGRLTIETPALAAADAAGPATQGGYAKFLASVYRIQGLSEDWRITLNYTGQWARDNLDSSEKFSVGGLAGVRAYPPGEAAGDDVQMVQLELRHQGFPIGPGQFVPFGFYDAARSHIIHAPFAGFAAKNMRELAGYGLGVEWSAPGSGFIRMWYARKAGSEPALAEPDRAARFWAQAGIVF